MISLLGLKKQYLAHPRKVPPIIENALNGKLRLLHPNKYGEIPRHNPHIKLTDAQIQEVMEETGANEEFIKKVAMWAPGQYLRFAAIKAWSCTRCVTCLGLVRKTFWCIICVATKPPGLSIREAAKFETKTLKPNVAPAKPLIKSRLVPAKLLRAGNTIMPGQPRLTTDYAANIYRMGITETEPSMRRRSHFPEMVDSMIWPSTVLSK